MVSMRLKSILYFRVQLPVWLYVAEVNYVYYDDPRSSLVSSDGFISHG